MNQWTTPEFNDGIAARTQSHLAMSGDHRLRSAACHIDPRHDTLVRFVVWSVLSLVPQTMIGQNDTGELRVKVTDGTGSSLPSRVTLVNYAGQINKSLETDSAGDIDFRRLPFGVYQVTVEHSGFANRIEAIELRSSFPATLHYALQLASTSTTVEVNSIEPPIDQHASGTVNRIGSDYINSRQSSLPGRTIVDLVNSQPGWLYEGNAVLHPRGSEYQTQFVVNGIPLTENRSPGFNTQIEAEDVQSLDIYTAGVPAEYGRKMGGIVEVNTLKDASEGWHGKLALSGGSFDTSDNYAELRYGTGRSSFGISTNGAYTNWYENPPVLDNFTNNATLGDFAGQYESDLTPQDHIALSARHEFARFLVPNELIQQQVGQRQDRDALETMGTASYQHIWSSNSILSASGMVRDTTTHLNSNAESTPIVADQDRGFREDYFKTTLTRDMGRHELKAGVEADFLNIHEGFAYTVTDPSNVDDGTPASFSFFQRGKDREQAAFVQDNVRLGNWTIAAGLRWDHYQLIVNESAFSPRLSISRYFPSMGLTAHASYDRVFQTPAFENILLSSSPQVQALNSEVLRLPVRPSHGNYYEAGVAKNFSNKLALTLNYFKRQANNFADDDQLLTTNISFPIAFRDAHIYGSEAKLELLPWHRFSGVTSYSYMVGSVHLPVTGGLFLGEDASEALTNTDGRFWNSQDQRNTLRTRYRYQPTPWLWIGAGAEYGSGLPTEFNGTEQQAVAQFGQKLVNRVDFARGRIRPSFAVNVSVGADLLKRENMTVAFHADGANLNNRINLIDFAGLFSGNAVAQPRSFSLRLVTSF
jgi:hypothetical protein